MPIEIDDDTPVLPGLEGSAEADAQTLELTPDRERAYKVTGNLASMMVRSQRTGGLYPIHLRHNPDKDAASEQHAFLEAASAVEGELKQAPRDGEDVSQFPNLVIVSVDIKEDVIVEVEIGDMLQDYIRSQGGSGHGMTNKTHARKCVAAQYATSVARAKQKLERGETAELVRDGKEHVTVLAVEADTTQAFTDMVAAAQRDALLSVEGERDIAREGLDTATGGVIVDSE